MVASCQRLATSTPHRFCPLQRCSAAFCTAFKIMKERNQAAVTLKPPDCQPFRFMTPSGLFRSSLCTPVPQPADREL